MSVQSTYSTAPGTAYEGMLYGNEPRQIEAMINEEASAEIPFGHAVIGGSTDPEKGALLPSAETDVVRGIVVLTQEYNPTYLGDDGLLPGAIMNVLRKGRIWVVCESGCSPDDRLWVRAVAGGGEYLGACENADDSTDTIDCTGQGVWRTSAAAGELAVLEVDFTNAP